MLSLSTDGIISFGQASALLRSLWPWAGSVTTIRTESSIPDFHTLIWHMPQDKAHGNLSWFYFALYAVQTSTLRTLTQFCFSSWPFILELPEHFPVCFLSAACTFYIHLTSSKQLVWLSPFLFIAGEKAFLSISSFMWTILLYHFVSACSCLLKTFFSLAHSSTTCSHI